jgi:XTP/dITP diphosphohydrolase
MVSLFERLFGVRIVTEKKVDGNPEESTKKEVKVEVKKEIATEKKKIFFVTTNNEKVKEICLQLEKFGIEVEGKSIELPESKSYDQEEVAKEKARIAAKELGQPVITEDTGLYLEAYENFPGTYSKFVFLGVGLNGILKLLEGKPRNAHFETIVGYCEPGSEPMIFVGICKGEITEEVHQPITHGVPYDSIFIPDGESRTFSEMTKEEKAKYSHRAKAINKFAEWFNARSGECSEDSGENSDSMQTDQSK